MWNILKLNEDSWYWRCRKVTLINCHKVQCNAKESITKDTFFCQSHLPLQKNIIITLYVNKKLRSNSNN